MKPNEYISDFINTYVKNKDPQYAVMLNGSWGCGKTFFIKKWMKEYNSANPIARKDDDNEVILQPIYVSLYGLHSILDIKTALDREINPFFYSKTGRFIKGFFNVVSKAVLNTSVDVNNDGKADATISGSIDILSIFKSKDQVKGDKVIIFDDIERCLIDIKELLGFINFFVEHCQCHVIVLCDENKIEGEGLKFFQQFKEKTIGRTFTISPNHNDAIDQFIIAAPCHSEYLKDKKNTILECFNCTNTQNLRILCQCLHDYVEQLNRLDNQDWITPDNIFLHSLLCSFIVVYAEFQNEKWHKRLLEWDRFCLYTYSSIDAQNDRTEIDSLVSKYDKINKTCTPHALSPEFVPHIINYITTGKPLTEFISNYQARASKQKGIWHNLENFSDIEDKQFNDFYTQSMDALLQRKIPFVYEIAKTIGFFIVFDALKIHQLSNNNKKAILGYITEIVNTQDDLNALCVLKNSFIDGYAYVIRAYNTLQIDDSFIQSFNKCISNKEAMLCNSLQKILRNLSDNNVMQLKSLDDVVMPNKNISYKMSVIFKNEDPKKLYDSISKMSNKGINEFASFLQSHYGYKSQGYMPDMPYKDDIKTLYQLKQYVDEAIKKAKALKRYTYQNLSSVLEESINYCCAGRNLNDVLEIKSTIYV